MPVSFNSMLVVKKSIQSHLNAINLNKLNSTFPFNLSIPPRPPRNSNDQRVKQKRCMKSKCSRGKNDQKR